MKNIAMILLIGCLACSVYAKGGESGDTTDEIDCSKKGFQAVIASITDGTSLRDAISKHVHACGGNDKRGQRGGFRGGDERRLKGGGGGGAGVDPCSAEAINDGHDPDLEGDALKQEIANCNNKRGSGGDVNWLWGNQPPLRHEGPRMGEHEDACEELIAALDFCDAVQTVYGTCTEVRNALTDLRCPIKHYGAGGKYDETDRQGWSNYRWELDRRLSKKGGRKLQGKRRLTGGSDLEENEGDEEHWRDDGRWRNAQETKYGGRRLSKKNKKRDRNARHPKSG